MRKAYTVDLDEYAAGLIARSESIVHVPDAAGGETLAAALCGIGGLSRDEMLAKLRGVKVPETFHHFRLYNLDTNEEWLSFYSCYAEVLELGYLVRQIDVQCEMVLDDDPDLGVWHETVALPQQHPGLLELGLRFRERRPTDSDEEWIVNDDEWRANGC